MMGQRKRRKILKPWEKFEARQWRESGMSIKQCAEFFDVSEATLMRALAEMREKFGPEKVPDRRRQYARHPIAMSQRVSRNTNST